MELKVYNIEKKEVGKINVEDEVFGEKVINQNAVHQMVVAQLHWKRSFTASTLLSVRSARPWHSW